jgi:PEP-CTERM motif
MSVARSLRRVDPKKMTITRALGGLSIAAILMGHATPARASAIQLKNASDLSVGGTPVIYPDGPLSNPFDITAGGVTLTFSTAFTSGSLFRDTSDGSNYDFPIGTPVLGTQDNGPLTITFSTGIREVGFFAQSLAFDEEAFTFDLFHGAAPLGTFNVGPADNSGVPGVALFIGARAMPGSDLITQLTISSTSSAGFDNDFVLGPVTVGQAIAAAPVPEPLSLVLLGTGLAGVGVKRWRRRAGGNP